jgi:hypothetical protein
VHAHETGAAGEANCLTTGAALEPKDRGKEARQYNLWTRAHTSRFEVDGQPVTLETCVHPTLDLTAVRAECPLLPDDQLIVARDFPYPNDNSGSAWVGDWNRPEAHASELTLRAEESRADIRRAADAATYHVRVAWAEGCVFTPFQPAAWRHTFKLTGDNSGRLECVCAFSSLPMDGLPTVKDGNWVVVWEGLKRAP